MTERDGFLAAIIADPTDDTPRLQYADWLEEHGEQERAEFIRVQCELAAIPAYRTLTGALERWDKEERSGSILIYQDQYDPGFKVGESFGIRHQNRDDTWFEADGLLVTRTQFTWGDRQQRVEFRGGGMPDVHKARRDLLRQREQQLLEAHGQLWLGAELLDPCSLHDDLDVTDFNSSGGDVSPVWRRGFVAEITLSCDDWLRHGEQLLRHTPLEKVIFQSRQVESVASCKTTTFSE